MSQMFSRMAAPINVPLSFPPQKSGRFKTINLKTLLLHHSTFLIALNRLATFKIPKRASLCHEDKQLCLCIHTVELFSADTVVASNMGDDLDQIDDMGEICDIMKSFHIPTKGLKGCEEVKAKLREFLKESATKRISKVN